MEFSKATIHNGSWEALLDAWEAECNAYEENLSDYATASLPVLSDLASQTPLKNSGVFVLSHEENQLAVCQANVAFLKGYDGPVLRVRHITFSPRFDYDSDIPLSEYTEALVEVFVHAIQLALTEMPAKHVKFHLRSPTEREYAQAFSDALQGNSAFTKVAAKGSWIYLSLV
jgi:hypothetical protein